MPWAWVSLLNFHNIAKIIHHYMLFFDNGNRCKENFIRKIKSDVYFGSLIDRDEETMICCFSYVALIPASMRFGQISHIKKRQKDG